MYSEYFRTNTFRSWTSEQYVNNNVKTQYFNDDFPLKIESLTSFPINCRTMPQKQNHQLYAEYDESMLNDLECDSNSINHDYLKFYNTRSKSFQSAESQDDFASTMKLGFSPNASVNSRSDKVLSPQKNYRSSKKFQLAKDIGPVYDSALTQNYRLLQAECRKPITSQAVYASGTPHYHNEIVQSTTSLFVGNISPEISEAAFMAKMEASGNLIESLCYFEPNCWSTAFLTYSTLQEAEEVLHLIRDTNIFKCSQDYRILCCYAPKPPDSIFSWVSFQVSSAKFNRSYPDKGESIPDKFFPKPYITSTINLAYPDNLLKKQETRFSLMKDGPLGANLFIYGIPNDWTEVYLLVLFQRFGYVVGLRVPDASRTKQANRGYAFVSYESRKSTVKAFREYHEKTVCGKKLNLQMKKNDFELLQDRSHKKQSECNPLQKKSYLESSVKSWGSDPEILYESCGDYKVPQNYKGAKECENILKKKEENCANPKCQWGLSKLIMTLAQNIPKSANKESLESAFSQQQESRNIASHDNHCTSPKYLTEYRTSKAASEASCYKNVDTPVRSNTTNSSNSLLAGLEYSRDMENSYIEKFVPSSLDTLPLSNFLNYFENRKKLEMIPQDTKFTSISTIDSGQSSNSICPHKLGSFSDIYSGLSSGPPKSYNFSPPHHRPIMEATALSNNTFHQKTFKPQ